MSPSTSSSDGGGNRDLCILGWRSEQREQAECCDAQANTARAGSCPSAETQHLPEHLKRELDLARRCRSARKVSGGWGETLVSPGAVDGRRPHSAGFDVSYGDFDRGIRTRRSGPSRCPTGPRFPASGMDGRTKRASSPKACPRRSRMKGALRDSTLIFPEFPLREKGPTGGSIEAARTQCHVSIRPK
jgi:hypothetical protein